MKNEALVEIVIPVYNTKPQLLQKCIDSISAQSYKNIKTIIIDDGSTNEETKSFLTDIKNSHKQIELHRKKNGGVSSARNYGITKLSGKYVIFVDADDYISTEYVKEMISLAKKKNVKVVYRKSIEVSESGNTINIEAFPKEVMDLREDMGKIVYRSYILCCHGAMIESELAKTACFDETLTIGEDTEYMLRILNNERFAYCEKAVYYYVVNSGSAMRTYSVEAAKRYFQDVNRLVLVMAEMYPEYDSQIRSILYNNLNNACDRICRSGIGMKKTIETIRRFKVRIANEATEEFERKRLDKRIAIWLLTKDRFLCYYLYDRLLIGLKNCRKLARLRGFRYLKRTKQNIRLIGS